MPSNNPSMATAAVQAGGGIFSSIINGLFNGYYQRKAVKDWQSNYVWQQMADWHNQKNYWNAYNSPEAQVKNLQAAGLSPGLSSPGSGSLSGSSANPNVPNLIGSIDTSDIIQNALSMYFQAKQQSNQDKISDSNIRKNEAEIKNIEAKTVDQIFKNEHLNPLQKNLYAAQVLSQQNENSIFHLKTQQLINDIQHGIYQNEIAKNQSRYSKTLYKYQAELNRIRTKTEQKYYDDYQYLGIRPNDPYYARIIGNLINSLIPNNDNKEKSLFGKAKDKIKNLYKKYFID